MPELDYEVLVNGVWVSLVEAVSPDACEHCLAGEWVGHDHPECCTLVPGNTFRY